MKKIMGVGAILSVALLILTLAACPQDVIVEEVVEGPVNSNATLRALRIAGSDAVIGTPGETPEEAGDGFVGISGPWPNSIASRLGSASTPGFVTWIPPRATVAYAVGAATDFYPRYPTSLGDGDTLWVRVTAGDTVTVQYYRINVLVGYVPPSFGEPDSAWLSDPYNQRFRIFPNAPANGILTREYFEAGNAPPSHWNAMGHNHRFPDPFRFANGNAVRNLADWESRRREISYILQFYMHGWKPSLAPDDVEITWVDSSTANSTAITVRHIESGRSFSFTATHNPPAGATNGARDRVLLVGAGNNPAGRDPAWGTLNLALNWGAGGGMGGGGARGGNITTLFGLNANDPGTPSSMMSAAWIMSVILTVIEEGGFRGIYNPDRVGIFGFSFQGKHAMVIGAFAQGRGGSQVAYTFVGSAGSGGPAVERFIPVVAYRGFAVDPLPDYPVGAAGAMSHSHLSSITWFQQRVDDSRNLPNHFGDTPNIRMVRGWTCCTPGIPAGSLVYDEEYFRVRHPLFPDAMDGLRGGFGGIQTLVQARNENAVWFSARFQQLQDLHAGLAMDFSLPNNAGRGTEGILCTMPFDSHFISALIAPRLIVYSEGFHPVRNNPEGQWANWLMTDEIYRMFAEELNDPLIVWRNTIRMYHVTHQRFPWQNADDALLVNTLHGGAIPHERFRMPTFPVDDPRGPPDDTGSCVPAQFPLPAALRRGIFLRLGGSAGRRHSVSFRCRRRGAAFGGFQNRGKGILCPWRKKTAFGCRGAGSRAKGRRLGPPRPDARST